MLSLSQMGDNSGLVGLNLGIDLIGILVMFLWTRF